MRIYLEVKDSKVAFMMELLRNLPFVKIKETVPSEALEGLVEGLKEIKLHQEGKIELPDAREVFDRLISENK